TSATAAPRRGGCTCLICHGSRLCSSGSEAAITWRPHRRRLSLAAPCRTPPMLSGWAASRGRGSALHLPSAPPTRFLPCVTSDRPRKSPFRRLRRVQRRLRAAAARDRPADVPAAPPLPHAAFRDC